MDKSKKEETYDGSPLLFKPGDILQDKINGSIVQIDSYDYEHTYKVYGYKLRVISDKRDPKVFNRNDNCACGIKHAHERFEITSDPTLLILFGDQT